VASSNIWNKQKQIKTAFTNKLRVNYIRGTLATIILSAVLYGCETWSLILREKLRLMVSENKLLRRIFGSKR
jgi:hypothetical protein